MKTTKSKQIDKLLSVTEKKELEKTDMDMEKGDADVRASARKEKKRRKKKNRRKKKSKRRKKKKKKRKKKKRKRTTTMLGKEAFFPSVGGDTEERTPAIG